MATDLSSELREKLLSVDSPTISNAIERFKVRPRREGFMGPQIACRFPDMGRVVGFATTCTIVEYDEKYPPDPVERFKWLESIANAPKPCVCVVKDTCHRKGWYSHWGEIVGTQVQVLGASAIITDGSCARPGSTSRHGHEGVERVRRGVARAHRRGAGGHPGRGRRLDREARRSTARRLQRRRIDPAEILDELPAAIDAVLEGERSVISHLREHGYDLEAHRRQIKH